MKLTPRLWNWNGDPTCDTWLGTDTADCPVLWQAWLPDDPAIAMSLVELLSAEERARLERLQQHKDKLRYLAARGLLRRLISDHIGISARSVSFDRGRFGKPHLGAHGGASWLHFNVSHSGDLILLGFSAQREVGVDVEQVRQDEDVAAIAAQVFSDKEYQGWLRLGPNERAPAFYRVWAHREAGLKALGFGLAGEGNKSTGTGLLRFEVDLAAGYAGAAAMVSAPVPHAA